MSRKGRILVLDDEEKWRQAFVSILRQADFYVDVAASTEEAEELLDKSFYHLAIIDISMLPGDGSDVRGMVLLGALDNANLLGAMEVIVVSAYGTMERMRKTFKQHKVADFQEKHDFDPPVFVSNVEQVFEEKVRINLNLDIHWQHVKDAEQVVTNLRIDGVTLKRDAELRSRMVEELDDLLCRLFHRARSLLINLLSPGQSGSAVLLVTPFYESGGGKPVVVKFGQLQKIDIEYKNFKEYAQPFIGGSRSTNVIELRRSPRLGGIVYSLLGTASDHLESFNTFYAHADSGQIAAVLNGLVHETCGTWYANPGHVQLIDLTNAYQQQLGYTKENLESALTEGLKSVQGKQKLYFENLKERGAFTNPIGYATEQQFSKPTYKCATHGDLNGSNVLVDAKGQSWLIDFESTGPGHILRDLAELDTVARFQLLEAKEATLDERLEMEEALGRALRFSDVERLASDFNTENEALNKAYETSVHIRTLAHKLVAQNPSDDLDEYSIALLYYSLNTIRFYSLPSLQRQHALLSASLLVDQLQR